MSNIGRPDGNTLVGKTVVLEQAGHGAYLDRPDEFNELLLDFLSEVM